MCECLAFHGTSVIMESTHTYAFRWGLTGNSHWCQSRGLIGNYHWCHGHKSNLQLSLIPDHGSNCKFSLILRPCVWREIQIDPCYGSNQKFSMLHSMACPKHSSVMGSWAHPRSSHRCIKSMSELWWQFVHYIVSKTFSDIRSPPVSRSYIFDHTLSHTNHAIPIVHFRSYVLTYKPYKKYWQSGCALWRKGAPEVIHCGVLRVVSNHHEGVLLPTLKKSFTALSNTWVSGKREFAARRAGLSCARAFPLRFPKPELPRLQRAFVLAPRVKPHKGSKHAMHSHQPLMATT